MNPQFKTGYKCNLYFYILEGLIAITVSLIYRNFNPLMIAAFSVFWIASIVGFSKAVKKPNLNCTTYGKLQSAAFVIISIFLSMAFDSAQVFVYAMCFSTIVNFVFIDVKVSRFQMIQSVIIAILAAGVISVYTGSRQTMLAYTFGTIMLLVMNWVVLSMTTHISFQYRKSAEQERSLDDMLRVVKVKCYEAQKATRSKSRFLAHMSHEIRTPINAIIGMNEMILRESNDRDICGYANETQNAAESLLGIINDILDITKIEAGKLNTIDVEYKLAPLITDIYNMIQFKAEAKGLKFNVDADWKLPSVLVGDDIRLKQIIINLLSNAVKYTHTGSVTLEIRYAENDNIFFSVKDTGIGIKKEDISRLFSAFDRMEEEKNRNIEGTGLGLNITSSLLKMFGSELKVQSVYGKGSEFSFTIKQQIVDSSPIGKIDLSAREYEHKPYSAGFTAPDAKILVVDDNKMNRKVFIHLLKRTKIHIAEASSGMECLEKIKETAFDIIFMDHMMPEMDGIQTLEAMRNQEENLCKNTPVIVLTANAIVGAEDFYLKKGFDGFISKPLDPKKLEKMVFTTLNINPDNYCPESIETPEDESTEEIEFPIISGIDWNYARLHFNDDSRLLSTVEMFCTSIKSDADELDSYCNDIDNDASRSSYRVKVHSMKSSAALIGIVQLSGMAMELEAAAKNGDCDIIRALHPIFIERWLNYSQALKVLTNTNNQKSNATEHIDEIYEIFEQIRNAAREMDVNTLDELSKKLDNYHFENADAEKIENIKSLIFNFEIEKLKECEFR